MNTNKTIDAVIWDSGQVVFFFPSMTWAEVWRLLPRVKATAARRDPADLDEAVQACQDLFEVGETTLDEHRLAVSEALGLDVPLTWAEFQRGYLLGGEELGLNQPLIETRRRLATGTGLAQGVLSNLCSAWRQALLEVGALEHLDEEVYSFREGLLKPSEELVVRMVDRLGVDAARTLVVDDRPESIAAAAAIGAQTHLFTGNAALADALAALGIPAPCLEPLRRDPIVAYWPVQALAAR
jgi:FMN phosphatase YigB (HAD superfamily)